MPDGKSDEEVPRQRILEERPASLSKPLPREKLPQALQNLADKDDGWDALYDGQYANSSPSSVISCSFVCNAIEVPIRPIQAGDMQHMQTGYEP